LVSSNTASRHVSAWWRVAIKGVLIYHMMVMVVVAFGDDIMIFYLMSTL
jgi:hypothetical protein